jgi:hypothetical protein
MREVTCIRRGAFAVLLAAACLLPPPALPQESPPGPRLVVAKTEIDAGTVVRGKVVEAVFELRNEGTADLRILSAKPG